MGIETGTKIADLNANWPLGTDPRSQGDDHLRLIKQVMKNDALSKAAGGIVTGDLTLSGGTPALRFLETDATSPAGQFSLRGYGTGSFGLSMFTGADWANETNIWRYIGSSGILAIDVPLYLGNNAPLSADGGVVLGGTVDGSTASIKIDASYPSIWFHDSTPSGGYADLMLIAGNSNFRLASTDASGVTASTFFSASPLSISTGPETSLATVGNQVNIGNTTGSAINFLRTAAPGYSYLHLPANSTTNALIVQGGSTSWATVNSTAGWAAGSDARMKHNIVDIGYGLDTVMALRAVEFDWNETNVHDIGFIAQEVREIVPEVIGEMPGEDEGAALLTLGKDRLVAILVKAVQEQQAQIVALVTRVTELEAAA